MSDDQNVEESRSGTRFRVEPPIAGQFGNLAVHVFDFGEGGMQAEHAEPLRLGTRGTMSLQLPRGVEPVRVRVAVVWSKLSERMSPKGKFYYRSGLRLDEDVEASRGIVEALVKGCFAQPDVGSLERKKEKLASRARRAEEQPRIRVVKRQGREIASDVVLLIQHARTHLSANPEESHKWYNRARFSLPPGSSSLHNRDEVLAVWEFLERSVSIEDVAWVLDHN